MNLRKNLLEKFELRRKFTHFILGVSLVYFINTSWLSKSQITLILVIMLIIALISSFLIKYYHPKHILKFLKLFDKPHDLENFPAKGAVFYIIGVLVSILLFDLRIASASILILAVGDPMAHFIGRYYGKRKLVVNRRKLLEGTLGGVFFGSIAASFVVAWPLAFFGAAFGMMAEALELEILKLDDNFFIPLVAGLTMSIIQSF